MVAYANMQNKTNAYRQNNAMTASPGELTLMLYDGCLKNLKLARMYLNDHSMEKAHEMFQKAQAIVAELQRTLDMQYEVSNQLFEIYRYLLAEMAEANIKKDAARTDILIELVTDMRDTWQQAIRINRQQVMGTGSVI